MAKRILIIDETGRCVASLSARHGSTPGAGAAERAHVERFIGDALALAKQRDPSLRYLALEVQTRRGEDEAILHRDLEARRATVHWRPDGTPEVTDLAATGTEPWRPANHTAVAPVALPYPALAAPPKLRAWR